MAAGRERTTETITVRYEGRRYQIERTHGAFGPGTVREYWPGHGLIGSEKRWLGDRFAAQSLWYAAVNPSGEPFRATARREQFRSRRAAIRWLLAETTPARHGVICDA